MYVVLVHVAVKDDSVEAFKEASIENAHNSLREPGIARFDVLQQHDDPKHFILLEVYRTSDDPAHHKETAHYKKWRETVEPMMADVRVSHKYENVFPDDQGWG
jgi:(4S)-4-hydroxy-5-phosphonooxypentane-2,3-dione isomerase